MEYVLIGTPITVNVSLSAAISNTPATGIVVLQSNGITVGTQELVSSGGNSSGTIFTVDSTLLGVGIHNFVVYYAGDANYAPTSFTSSSLQKNIAFATPTSSVLTVNNSSVNFNQVATFTCTLTSADSINDGQVQLYINGSASEGPVSVVATSTGATASIMSSGFSFGSNSVHTVYTSDTVFESSTSNTVNVNLNPLTPTVVLQSSINPSTYNSNITLNGIVSSSVGPMAIGTITFYDGSSPISSAIALSSGAASASVSNLSSGSHSLTARYSGSASYNAAVSPAVVQVINSATTSIPSGTLAIKVSGSSIGTFPNYTTARGSSIVFTAVVSSAGGTPAGTVIFTDTNSNSPFASPGVSVQLDGGGTATTTNTWSSSDVGSHSITISYLGNSNYGSSSVGLTLSIT